MNNFLDIVEAAKYLGISRNEFYIYLRLGIIKPEIDKPRHRLFSKAGLDKAKTKLKKGTKK